MSSSAPDDEQCSAPLEPPPSTSPAASQGAVPGRKRKANFSNAEIEALVKDVIERFGALYGSEPFRAHRLRRKQLWTQIQTHVNVLGYTKRSVNDLKHKWRDLRLEVKKKMTDKKPPASHPAGTPYKPQLTPLEELVASTFLQSTDDQEPETAQDPADSGPEGRVPETLTDSLRNDSLVSYTSDEENAEGPDGDEDQEPQLSEEDLKFSRWQRKLLHPWSPQGSPTSEPEDTLTQAGGRSEFRHDESAGLPAPGPQTQEEESKPPNTDLGPFPWGLMGPTWETKPYEDQQQQPSVSSLGTRALTEESLPFVSPYARWVSPSHSLPQGIGGSRPQENRPDLYRATLHRLMEIQVQWDQLYHHELAVWRAEQAERAQQWEERARDRDLQLQLLAVLTEIRDDLRCFRQERAASRQERASQTGADLTLPCLPPNSEASLPNPEEVPPSYTGQAESCFAGASLPNGGRGEGNIGLRSPRGVFPRVRGRSRGSMSRQRRLVVSNT